MKCKEHNDFKIEFSFYPLLLKQVWRAQITIFRIKFSNVVERNVRHFVMNDLYRVADKLKLQLCQIQKCIFYYLE